MERIAISIEEAEAAGDFSAPVEIAGALWWIKERPIFEHFQRIALVAAERVHEQAST